MDVIRLEPRLLYSSHAAWNHVLKVPIKRGKVNSELQQLLFDVKRAAERVIAIRRRDNVGGSPFEAAVLQRVKDARKRMLVKLKERVDALMAFKADPLPVSPALSTGLDSLLRCKIARR
jgi:hypothetical protein